MLKSSDAVMQVYKDTQGAAGDACQVGVQFSSFFLSLVVLIVCRNRHTGNKGGMEGDFVGEKTKKEGCLHKAQEDAASDEKESEQKSGGKKNKHRSKEKNWLPLQVEVLIDFVSPECPFIAKTR